MAQLHNRSILTGSDEAVRRERMALFGRHFVYLVANSEYKGAEQPPQARSAFLMELNGACYLVTAGHNITGLREARDKGFTFSNFSAIDVFAGGEFKHGVPLGIGLDDFEAAFEDDRESIGMDVALCPLPDFHVRSLAANGTIPVPATADMQELVDQPYDKMMLAGVPEETVERSVEGRWKKLDVTLACLLARCLGPDEASPVITHGAYERIYGQLGPDVADHLASIVGTSGGPIFGLWYSPGGSQFRYTVIGIQSSWDPTTRQIAAWPIGYIIKFFLDAQ